MRKGLCLPFGEEREEGHHQRCVGGEQGSESSSAEEFRAWAGQDGVPLFLKCVDEHEGWFLAFLHYVIWKYCWSLSKGKLRSLEDKKALELITVSEEKFCPYLFTWVFCLLNVVSFLLMEGRMLFFWPELCWIDELGLDRWMCLPYFLVPAL